MMSPVPLRAGSMPPAPVPAPAPVQPADPMPPHLAAAAFGGTIQLVPPRGFRSAKFLGIMFIIGGLFGGVVVFGALTILEFILTFMGGGGPSPVAIVCGVGVALFGICTGVFFLSRGERETSVVTVGANHVSIALPEWTEPLVVPRESVQFVTVDDRPLEPFCKNERFAIEGALPHAAFADALDRDGRNPWEPARSPVPYQLPTQGAAKVPPVAADAAEHDDGWATVGSRPRPEPRGRHGYLYSGDGSALPLFVYNELDIPNLAIAFRQEMALPKRSQVFFMMQRRSMRASNARRARGILLRARNGVQAQGAFAPWNVVRAPHADEILSAGLRPPKPLRGLRAWAFAATLLAPLILRLVLRDW